MEHSCCVHLAGQLLGCGAVRTKGSEQIRGLSYPTEKQLDVEQTCFVVGPRGVKCNQLGSAVGENYATIVAEGRVAHRGPTQILVVAPVKMSVSTPRARRRESR